MKHAAIHTLWVKGMWTLLHHLRAVEAPQDGAEGSSVPLVRHLASIVALCCKVVEGLPGDLLQWWKGRDSRGGGHGGSTERSGGRGKHESRRKEATKYR